MPDVFQNPISAQDLIALYRRAESRAARLRLLIGAGRDLATAVGIEAASAIVLRAAAEFGAYDAGCLMFLDANGRDARVVAVLGQTFPRIGRLLPLPEGIDHDEPCAPALRHYAESEGLTDLLALLKDAWVVPFGGSGPVSERGAMVLAANGIAPETDAEDHETLRLLASILGAMAVIARQRSEQVRLNGILEQREARLAELVGKLISVQEDERRQLSIELHDGIAQLMSGAHQYFQAHAQRLGTGDAEASELFRNGLALLRQATSDIRTLLVNLRPTILDDFGIATAIRKELDQFGSDGTRVRFLNGIAGLRLPADMETAFFRVFQESLRNVRRHAQASGVLVELVIEDALVVMRVVDDGAGFDASSQGDRTRPGERLGLLGIQERMRGVGGDCRIESEPGRGTRVEASIALSLARPEKDRDA
jgi:signal transduction histidine kinase